MKDFVKVSRKVIDRYIMNSSIIGISNTKLHTPSTCQGLKIIKIKRNSNTFKRAIVMAQCQRYQHNQSQANPVLLYYTTLFITLLLHIISLLIQYKSTNLDNPKPKIIPSFSDGPCLPYPYLISTRVVSASQIKIKLAI